MYYLINCAVHHLMPNNVSSVQVALAGILGVVLGVCIWQLGPQPSNSSNKAIRNDVLAALDKEAANSTAQYWFGPEDQQQQDRPK
jgi:hypothetical protein